MTDLPITIPRPAPNNKSQGFLNKHVHGPSCDQHDHEHNSTNNLFPLEEKIKELNVNHTIKQLLTMISNLIPAMGVAEIAGSFHVNPFISSPLAISAMHFTNRGTNAKHLPKLLLTALSSVGILALQKTADLPRIFIRPIMALAVFFSEKLGHVHTDNHTDNIEQKENNHEEHNHKKITKSDWINLLKLQGQINTVPWLANLYTSRLKELNEQNNNLVTRFLGKIGISTLHIAGLSLGFVGLGHLIDKSLTHFNIISDKESIAMRTEVAVCACGCGAPVCIAEVASEAGAMSITL